MGGKNENGRVVSPVNIPITIKASMLGPDVDCGCSQSVVLSCKSHDQMIEYFKL